MLRACTAAVSASNWKQRLAPFRMKRNFDTLVGRHQPTSASMASTTASIQLTARERQLKSLLLDVATSINEEGFVGEPVILRWAGGWVRDKLLGIESHDIDTAINAMTGYAFSLRIAQYCESPRNIEKHSIGPDDLGSLHRIAANPEKSKHLETATTRIFGLELDFVNLRKETYAQDSRNPTMEFGTAEEDALRRDATINALFYNLHTDQVEDFTRGLPDMSACLIRTPLEPFQTFIDDPLRVLRLVRFASRLNFAIDPAAKDVMGDSRVLDALRLKISRERVGVEIEKMLKGKDPCCALRLIDNLGLYHAIFTDPTRGGLPSPDVSRWKVVYECLDTLVRNKAHGSIYEMLIQSDEAAYFGWTLAALAPWEHLVDPDGASAKNKLGLPLATLVAREGVKAPNKLCDVVTASHKHRTEILSLKQGVCRKAPFLKERDTFGMAIRKWDAHGGHWRVQVLHAILIDAMDNLRQGSDDDTTEFFATWQTFLDHLVELDVVEAPSLARLVDGRKLAKELGLKPGKWMGRALDVCVAWQLRHPGETDFTGAINEVRRRAEELEIEGLLPETRP